MRRSASLLHSGHIPLLLLFIPLFFLTLIPSDILALARKCPPSLRPYESGNAAEEGFAIYPVKNGKSWKTQDDEKFWKTLAETLGHPSANLDKIEIEENPLITEKDIIAYDGNTHYFDVTEQAIQRIRKGRRHIDEIVAVCVAKKPRYVAVILDGICEVASNAVVIMIPSPAEPPSCTISIELGYPTPEWYTGNDPRDDFEILNALRSSGKLVELNKKVPVILFPYF